MPEEEARTAIPEQTIRTPAVGGAETEEAGAKAVSHGTPPRTQADLAVRHLGPRSWPLRWAAEVEQEPPMTEQLIQRTQTLQASTAAAAQVAVSSSFTLAPWL